MPDVCKLKKYNYTLQLTKSERQSATFINLEFSPFLDHPILLALQLLLVLILTHGLGEA